MKRVYIIPSCEQIYFDSEIHLASLSSGKFGTDTEGGGDSVSGVGGETTNYNDRPELGNNYNWYSEDEEGDLDWM